MLHWKVFFVQDHLYFTELLFEAGIDLNVVTSDLHGPNISLAYELFYIF